MSSFTSPLKVSPLESGSKWQVLEEFSYHVGAEESHDVVRISSGFETDFASIPRLIWLASFWLLPDWAKYNKASPVHDYLYTFKKMYGENGMIPVGRRQADGIFHEAMLVDFRNHNSGKLVARVEWLAVRLFGWVGY